MKRVYLAHAHVGTPKDGVYTKGATVPDLTRYPLPISPFHQGDRQIAPQR